MVRCIALLGIALAVVSCRGREASTSTNTGSAGGSGSALATGSTPADDAAPGIATDGGPDTAVESLGLAVPQVTLDKPGTEPRQRLAYARQGGERTTKLKVAIGMEGAPPGVDTTMTLVLAWQRPVDVSRPYELTVKESRAEIPTDAKGGERGVIGAVGAMYSNISLRVDADASGRGRVIRTSDTIPTRPSLLWLVHPLIVPLPPEPVGVGARWQVTQPLQMDSLEGQLTRTYELTRVRGDTLHIAVTGATRWRGAAMPADDDIVESIAGSYVVALSDLLPQSAEVALTQALGPAKAITRLELAP